TANKIAPTISISGRLKLRSPWCQLFCVLLRKLKQQWAELYCTDLGAGVKKDSGLYTLVHHAADRGTHRQTAGAVWPPSDGECDDSKRGAPTAIALGLCCGLVAN